MFLKKSWGAAHKILQEYAVKHQCSLYISLETNLDNEIFKGTKAAQFVALIENLPLIMQKDKFRNCWLQF